MSNGFVKLLASAGEMREIHSRKIDNDFCRAVAQLGRAPASGAGGRGFKSHQPDSIFHPKPDYMKHSILLLSAIVLIELAAPSYAVDVPSDVRSYTVSAAEPNWWGLARRGMRGRVVAQMTIDPKTGEVSQVQLLRKTIYAELNAEIVLTCFKWKFKPHTITSAKVPFELIVSGYVRQVH